MQNTLPADWNDETPYHGLSKSETHLGYLVKLSVNKKQRHIGIAFTQEAAARLYDAALWKFAPFIDRPLKPNFPLDFPNFIQRDIDHIFGLNDLFKKVKAELKFTDEFDESDARDARLSRNAIPPGKKNADPYATLGSTVVQTRVTVLKSHSRIAVLRAQVNLTKFPQIAVQLDNLLTTLDAADQTARAVSELLASHESLYNKGVVS